MTAHGTRGPVGTCADHARPGPLGYDRLVTDPRDETSSGVDRTSLEAEVIRVVGAADAAAVPIRALGSIGVALHAHEATAMLPSFARTYADIDVAAYRRDAKTVVSLLEGLGYRHDREIFIRSEGGRSIFDDPARRIHIDVFYDRLDFCHVIPLAGRLEVDHPTIPLAELLLSKLQIYRINEKDIVDATVLLLDHPLARGDTATIDIDRVARLCADDWGLWRTITQNLAKVAALVTTFPQLDDDQRSRVVAATTALKERIDAEPTSMAWRMRARVGDRRQWWTEVDEVR